MSVERRRELRTTEDPRNLRAGEEEQPVEKQAGVVS